MLVCSIWFCAPSVWMVGGLESRCVGHVYGADGAAWHHPHPTHDLTTVTQPPDCRVPWVVFRRWRGWTAKTDHSPASSTVVKNERCFTSILPYVFMACRGTTLPMDSASWSSDWYPCFVVWSSQAVFELRGFGVLSEHYREFRLSLTVKCFDVIVHKHSKSVTDNHPPITLYNGEGPHPLWGRIQAISFVIPIMFNKLIRAECVS